MQKLKFLCGSWTKRPKLPSQKELDEQLPVVEPDWTAINSPDPNKLNVTWIGSLYPPALASANHASCGVTSHCLHRWNDTAALARPTGHASFLVQLGGFNVLTDPGATLPSPLSRMLVRFPGKEEREGALFLLLSSFVLPFSHFHPSPP